MVNPHVIIIVFWWVTRFIHLHIIYDIFPCEWSAFHHNTTTSPFQNHNPTIIPLYSQCIPNISICPSRVAIPAVTIKNRQPGLKETSRAASAMRCLQQDRACQGFFFSIGIWWEESSGNTILSEAWTMDFYVWDYEILRSIVEFNNELSPIVVMIGNMDFHMNHKWIIYNYNWRISIQYPHIGKPTTIYESHPYWRYDWYENIGLSDDLNRKTLKFDGLKPDCFSIFLLAIWGRSGWIWSGPKNAMSL